MNETEVRWYILRCHTMRFPRVWKELEEQGVEIYVPLIEKIQTVKGRKVKSEQPFLRDMLFARASYEDLLFLQQRRKIPFIFYFSHTSHIQNDALWVRDDEMRTFQQAVLAFGRQPKVRMYGEIDLQSGQSVRLLSGPFEGKVARYVQVRRGQKRRLVLTLSNLMTVDVSLLPDDLIEVVDEK